MKVAFVSQPLDGVIPPYQSSIGIWTYQVARQLAQSCEVIVYSKWMRSQPKVDRDGKVRYRFVAAAPNRVLLGLSRLFSRFRNARHPFFATSLYNLEYSLQVALDLKKQQPDIIHIHNFSQFVPVFRALHPKAKIVLHMHCEWLTQLDQAMIERRLRQTDLVVGCSQYITEKNRQRFPQFASRCQTVFNGVDVYQFSRQNGHAALGENGAKQLLFVGRVSPEKGLHVLLDAFQEVVKRYPKTQLKIVGSAGSVPVEFIIALSEDGSEISDLAFYYQGDYLDHLRGQLTADLASQVVFTGPVPHSRVVNHYRKANVLINPSFSEAFGMSLIEAMASEVPVVATRVGGMADIVKEGKTGLLVEPGDASAMANAIQDLLEDEDLRQAMGKAGRQRAIELFSWDRITDYLLQQYERKG